MQVAATTAVLKHLSSELDALKEIILEMRDMLQDMQGAMGDVCKVEFVVRENPMEEEEQ